MRELGRLCESYGDLLRHLDPAAANAAGSVSDPGRLGQFDGEALREHLAAFRATAAAIEELEVDALADEIDRTALLDDVRSTISRLEEDRPSVRNPAFWTGHLARSLAWPFLRPDPGGPPAPRATIAGEQIAAIPRFLESARATLVRPPLALVDAALTELGTLGELLVQTATAIGSEAPGGSEAFNLEVADALQSLTRFGYWLRSEVEPEAGLGGAVLGEARFERRIHHRYAIREGPSELWRYATRLLDETEAALAAEGRGLDSARSWRDLLDRLEPETVPALAGVNGELERVQKLFQQHGIPVASGPEPTVVPPFLRGVLADITYVPAFESIESGGARLLLPTDRLSRIALPAIAAAALAGRHLQESRAQGLGSEVRRRLRSAAAVEGWTLYAEQWMEELGFFTEPGARLGRLARVLRAAGGLAVDVGIHARGMTIAQAMALLTDRAGFARDGAETELRRILPHPTDASAAALGRREILALRMAAGVPAQGGTVLDRFHAELLGFGALPPGLAGWGMGLER